VAPLDIIIYLSIFQHLIFQMISTLSYLNHMSQENPGNITSSNSVFCRRNLTSCFKCCAL